MKAVILVAGQGRRLLPYTKEMPKCLVPVCGIPLIEYQVRVCEMLGIDDILVVTGYKGNMVANYLGDRVKYNYNALYESTNSMYSLWITRDMIDDDILLFNGDILVSPRIISRMLKCNYSNVIAVDSRIKVRERELNVICEEGRISRLSLELSKDESTGECIQVMKIGREAQLDLFLTMEKIILYGDVMRHPSYAVNRILHKHYFSQMDTLGQPWAEIDCPGDIVRVENMYKKYIERWREKQKVSKGHVFFA